MNNHIELDGHRMTSVETGDASIPVQDEERTVFLETVELVGLSMPTSNVMFTTVLEPQKCFRGNLLGPLPFESGITTDLRSSRKRSHDQLENPDVYLNDENSAVILFPQLNRGSISMEYCTDDARQQGAADSTTIPITYCWLLFDTRKIGYPYISFLFPSSNVVCCFFFNSYFI